MSATTLDPPRHRPVYHRPVSVLPHLGITYRQFDYWCRTGAITITQAADGSGSRRLLSELDHARLAVLGRLDEFSWGLGGLPHGLIRAVWDVLNRPIEQWPTHLVVEAVGRSFAVTDLVDTDVDVALVIRVAP